MGPFPSILFTKISDCCASQVIVSGTIATIISFFSKGKKERGEEIEGY
jgi:hypothetical protein